MPVNSYHLFSAICGMRIASCLLLNKTDWFPTTTQPWKTTATRILVDTAVKIKQTGFSESFGRCFSDVSASHKQNCTAGNRQTKKASQDSACLFYFRIVFGYYTDLGVENIWSELVARMFKYYSMQPFFIANSWLGFYWRRRGVYSSHPEDFQKLG